MIFNTAESRDNISLVDLIFTTNFLIVNRFFKNCKIRRFCYMKVEQIVLIFKDAREHTVRLNKEKLVLNNRNYLSCFVIYVFD